MADAAVPRWRHTAEPLQLVPAINAFGEAGAELGARPPFEPLFQPLSESVRAALDTLPAALDAVMPLTAAHRRDLPDAVHELSLLLTSERRALAHPYWSSPRLTSAYMRYFLPWNIIRLARLLPELPLGDPQDGALLVDLGSGPLTFVLALWLARPAWRTCALEVLAVDTAAQPLELGRRLFEAMAPESPWRIRTLRAPLHKALRDVRGRPFLVSAGNVLNELSDRADTPLAERMEELAESFAHLVDHGGTVCCVEPGTRLGGLLLSQLRAGALEAGLEPCSPCTHAQACPLLEGRARGWCHAVLDAGGAPVWLRELTSAAGLGKTSLSLSHLVLRAADVPKVGMPPTPAEAVRVLSDAFAVPGLGLARYACSSRGLVLLPGAQAVPQGAQVLAKPVQPPRTDAKSGARVFVIEPAKGALR